MLLEMQMMFYLWNAYSFFNDAWLELSNYINFIYC